MTSAHLMLNIANANPAKDLNQDSKKVCYFQSCRHTATSCTAITLKVIMLSIFRCIKARCIKQLM